MTCYFFVLSGVYACMCTTLHACVTFGRAGRITRELVLTAAHRSWTPAFSCSTVTLCTHTNTLSWTHTHTHTRLIDQIDLHMSDGANFSPFPPLVNLWPLIYAELNLYTLIMLSGSLSFTHTHSGLLCGLQCSAVTHALAASAQVMGRKYRNMLKDSGSV